MYIISIAANDPDVDFDDLACSVVTNTYSGPHLSDSPGCTDGGAILSGPQKAPSAVFLEVQSEISEMDPPSKFMVTAASMARWSERLLPLENKS